MKQWMLAVMISLALFLSCADNRAKDLYDTATLEELQNNPSHAKQLYQEIIEKYPQTDYAKEAKQRLTVLNQ